MHTRADFSFVKVKKVRGEDIDLLGKLKVEADDKGKSTYLRDQIDSSHFSMYLCACSLYLRKGKAAVGTETYLDHSNPFIKIGQQVYILVYTESNTT